MRKKEKNRLTSQQIIDNWETRAMYVDWGDGSDSLLQDNGYSLEDALDYKAKGFDIFFD